MVVIRRKKFLKNGHRENVMCYNDRYYGQRAAENKEKKEEIYETCKAEG